jgi:hypothetical protein
VIISGSKRLSRVEDLLPADLAGQLDRLDVTSRKVFAGKLQGERRSKQRGSSVEFADHRNYVPGDDLRRIDWNVFARLDRFFVKIFQEEQDLTVSVILDASASMDAGSVGHPRVPPATFHAPGAHAPSLVNAGNKLAFAQRLATALAYVGLVRNNRVVVSILDGANLRRLAPVRGRGSVQRVARFILDAARAEPGTGGVLSDDEFYAQQERAPGTGPIPIGVRGDWTSALRALAATRGGRGVCILISDFLIPGRGGYQAGLNYLAGRGFDTFCVQVLSPAELDPALEGRDARGTGAGGGAGGAGGTLVGDLELTDAETGRAAEVTMTAELIERYRATVKRYIAELAAFCAARSMTHVPLVSDMDLRGVLVEQLRRQRLLGS